MPANAPTGSAFDMRAVGGAAMATLAWGASSVIAKALEMDGLAIVAYRFGLASTVFLIYLGATGQMLSVAKMRQTMPAGVALAVDVALFFSAVKLTTVANATVIGALQPVLMLVLARRLLGEAISRVQVFWSLVAVGGAVFLVFGSSGLPGWSLKGDLLAVGALGAWTIYIFLAKTTQTDDDLTAVEFTASVAIYTSILTLPLALLFGQDLSWPSTESWILLTAMAFGSGLFAHLLMNWSLARIPVSVGSAMTLLIPISATLLAWAFVDEELTWVQVIGIAVTLLALGAITREKRQTAE